MTADDFLLMFIAIGGFLIVAGIFWIFALVADRRQNKKRDPDVRSDPDSPDASKDDGHKEAARTVRTNDFHHRFAGATGGRWPERPNVTDSRLATVPKPDSYARRKASSSRGVVFEAMDAASTAR